MCWDNVDIEGPQSRPYRQDRLALAVRPAHPLTDRWAERRFIVCCRDFDALQPAAQHMVDHLAEHAKEAANIE